MTNTDWATEIYSDVKSRIGLGTHTLRRLRGTTNQTPQEARSSPLRGDLIAKGGFSAIYENAEQPDGHTATILRFTPLDTLVECFSRDTLEVMLARPVALSIDPQLNGVAVTPFEYTRGDLDGTPCFVTCTDRMESPLGRRMWELRRRSRDVFAAGIAFLMPESIGQYARLHEAGYVIGDIKPDNILLDKHDRPLIADLDTLRLDLTGLPDEGTDTAYLGKPIRWMVTPEYTSCRINLKPRRIPSKQDDIEAAGVMVADLVFNVYEGISHKGNADLETIRARRQQFLKHSAPYVMYSKELEMPHLYEVARTAMVGEFSTMREFAGALDAACGNIK